jgi:four helix bundle protein
MLYFISENQNLFLMGDFKKLDVWSNAKDLAVYIYKITEKGLISKDFGLRDQMRRAAVSIPSNIAEGEESGRKLKGINFLYISKGSLAELQTQAIIAYEIGYLDSEILKTLDEKINQLSSRLRRLIQYRENCENG